jgi:hypothetical protein
MSYGIPIEASMIVGFDNDELDIFEKQFDFIMEANFPNPRMHMLNARKNTELWDQLEAEGRIVNYSDSAQIDLEFDSVRSNILPKRMSQKELHENFLKLIDKLFQWENFHPRLVGFINNINQKPESPIHFSQLPGELDLVANCFEVEIRDDVRSVLLLAINKHPKIVFTTVFLLLRFRDERAQTQHFNKIGINGFCLEELLEKP